MFWFTLFLLCITLEIITGTGWLLVISLGALSSAIVGFFLPISQEANICFFASISILASIIKFFYDKKHKKLDTLLVNTGHSRFKGKEFTLSDDIVTARGNYSLVIHSGLLRRYTMKTTQREQELLLQTCKE
ncbi:NfeD-like C-terminal, partner-binding [Escherichia coli]|uniref:NfeD-like C-terminal, partner-binding n=1 Tax=Escherichia coli TaxID=562 RepID=A0A377CYR4_ECOLX|nr:NfeD-like C-terminal, partner-binding [Escherichia coli]